MEKRFRDPDFDMDAFFKENVESWRKLADEHFPDTDDFTTVVLKAHLILEQYLTRLISRYCRVPKYLEAARLTFWQRIQLAKAFLFCPVPSEIWRGLELLNSIRNDVAHNLSPGKLAGHIAQVRGLPMCAPSNKGDEQRLLKSDSGVIKCLFGFCSGSLQVVDVVIAAMEKDKKERWLASMEAEKKEQQEKGNAKQ
jgi:hypothetical protein